MYFTLSNIFMKKAFIVLWQWILKHRKKLIYWALALFVIQFCFFNLWWIWIGGNNEVFAQSTQGGDTATHSEKFRQNATSRLSTFSFLQKIIYVFLYPLLWIAWKLVDNSLVYGEVFWFDAVLRDLRNIVRNLANFWLWFIFIYKIFEILINGKEGENIKKLLIQSLIAGVWIQASWFAMAALIDISSILTYWVWGLPISVLEWKEKDTNYNPYVIPSVISVDASDVDSSQVYLSNMPLLWDKTAEYKFISECETFHYEKKEWDKKIGEEEVIIAPKMVYYLDWNGEFYPTDMSKCHIWDQIYFFGNGLCQWLQWETSSWTWRKDAQNEYNNKLKGLRTNLEWAPNEVSKCISDFTILRIWESNTGNVWLDQNNEWIWAERWSGTMIRLNQIMTGDGYVGVFTTLYSSLMNVWADLRATPTTTNWVYASLLNVILSFAHMVAIAIPLIAMVVVFIMRIAVLWMGISLSPLIVLLTAFELDKKIEDKSILSYIKLKNLIPIIFSPVVICFAISMSTVLVKIINNMNKETVQTLEKPILWWLVHLDIAGMWVNLWKMICSIICIAITRFLVWAAVKMSKLWESSIIWWIEKLAKTSLWSIPLIPVPWKNWKWVEFMWVWTVFGKDWDGWIINKITNKVRGEFDSKEAKTVEDWLNPENAAEEALEKQTSAYWDRIKDLSIWEITNGWISAWMEIWERNKKSVTFDSLTNDQKETIIQKINDLKDSKQRDAFWQVSEIKVWSKTYKYTAQTDADGTVEKDKDGNEIKKFTLQK